MGRCRLMSAAPLASDAKVIAAAKRN